MVLRGRWERITELSPLFPTALSSLSEPKWSPVSGRRDGFLPVPIAKTTARCRVIDLAMDFCRVRTVHLSFASATQ